MARPRTHGHTQKRDMEFGIKDLVQRSLPLGNGMILFLLLILVASMKAQAPPVSGMKKNVISMEGEFAAVAGNFSLNYERIFPTDRKVMLGLKGGAGRYYYNSYYFYMIGPIPALEESGIRTNSIAKMSVYFMWPRGVELGLGLAGFIDEKETGSFIRPWPVINFGYRKNFEWIHLRFYVGAWGLGGSVGVPF